MVQGWVAALLCAVSRECVLPVACAAANCPSGPPADSPSSPLLTGSLTHWLTFSPPTGPALLPHLQARLMSAIEQQNVYDNFDMALEHNPEAFSSVCML